MAKKVFGPLTETMFYVLMALLAGPKCGTQIAEFTEKRTGGRVNIGPGTLYAILSKFEEEKLIREIAVCGRKRTYEITERGTRAYCEELARLKQCLKDAQEAER